MMPGAEESLTGAREPRPAPSTETESPRGNEPWVATTGLDAVNSTERAICGSGAVRNAGVAQGQSLAGRRAATLLELWHRAAPPVTAGSDSPWVHHRVRPDQPVMRRQFPVELVAGDAQEAVDHCLAARRIAERLQRPCLCTVDRATAEGLALIRLPRPEQIEETVDVTPIDEAEVPNRPLQATFEAFRAVAKVTGRRLEPLFAEHADDADCVLVVTGAATAPARRIAARLRTQGVACGLVRIALLDPFPREALAEQLRSVPKIAVIEAAERAGVLTVEVRASLGDQAQLGVRTVRPPKSGDEADLDAAVREALGLPTAAADAAAEAEAEAAAERVVLGVTPAARWSEAFLLDAAARLRRLGPIHLFRPAHDLPTTSVLVIQRGDVEPTGPVELDLLLVADPASLTSSRVLDAVRPTGSLALCAQPDRPDAVWSALGEEQRDAIRDRQLHLCWTEFPEGTLDRPFRQKTLQTLLHGALFKGVRSLGALVGHDEGVVQAMTEPARPGAVVEGEATLLLQGADALRVLEDPKALDAPRELAFKPVSGLPRMPGERQAETSPEWVEALRHFHLTGEGAFSPTDPLPVAALRPANLDSFAEPERDPDAYPLVLNPSGVQLADGAPGLGLAALLERSIGLLRQRGTQIDILGEHVPRIVRAVVRLLESRDHTGPLREVLFEALERIEDEFDLSEAGTIALKGELAALRQQLPQSGWLLGLGRLSLLRLYVQVVRAARSGHRAAFREEITRLSERLTELLVVAEERDRGGARPETLKGALGPVGEGLLDPDAMAQVLPSYRGSKPLEPERLLRIKQALANLRRYLAEEPALAEMILVHRGFAELEVPEGVRTIDHADGMHAAIGLFDGLAERMVDVLRAVRVARLEADRAYDPALHDRVLRRFNWQAFTADELLLLPPVVVLETGRRLRGRALGSFSELLRSGRPVHVLVAERTADLEADETWEALSGYSPALGYLAVAHREAFVLQSTLGRPEHLMAGLVRMGSTLSPAVALMAVPSWEAPVLPWLQLAAAHESRATPCFIYDPGAGTTWAERFSLAGNPQVERPWPQLEVPYIDAHDREESRSEAFTFAHAAAIDPAYRQHFRVIPTEAWSDEQVELAEFLANPSDGPRQRLPFIWIRRVDNTLARAVITRELAFASRDRMRAWRILQELAGTDNEYAHRAATAARADALEAAGAERRELERQHAAELNEVRRTAAGEAMDRLARVLLQLDSLPATEMVGPAAAGAAAQPAAASATPVATPAAAEAEEEEEEGLSFNEPHIDSMLCTSCNECINLNSRLFRYNANKQAEIADPNAGTFEQLVKAAEKCPARCIHPGVPREDDATATPEVIARARTFA